MLQHLIRSANRNIVLKTLNQQHPIQLIQVRYAGHNKWSKIKHSKGAKDLNRGTQFAKLGLEIISAIKSGGEDPKSNLRLSSLLDKAKTIDFSKKNLDSAFKKGLGQTDDPMDEMVYQGYGPNGVSVIIETITDSKNRTVKAIRSALTRSGGSMTDISWMFDKKGKIELKFNPQLADHEKLMELFIELDCEDFDIDQEAHSATVICSFDQLGTLGQSLSQHTGYEIKLESMEPYYMPKDPLVTSETSEEGKTIGEFLNKLEDMDDVFRIHSNVQFTQ